MNVTHYMELLAVNQPWNLLLFMGVPVILAETIAITELYLLYTRSYRGPVRVLNRGAGILAGFYFLGVFLYLMANAVLPLTMTQAWRGWIDMIAVGFYLVGVIPLVGIALVDLGLLGRGRPDHERFAVHAAFVAVFLVVAHIAMIFGMMDPALGGAAPVVSLHHHG